MLNTFILIIIFFQTNRNPPPSFAAGAMAGSAIDRYGTCLDTDDLLTVDNID